MSNIKIMDSARIVGRMRLGDGVYIAQGTTVRSNDNVVIGNNSWALENSTLIGTNKNPLKIGRKTVFGHKCLVIGAEIGDLCEVGNGTIFMPGCRVGDMCIFGEGTLVPGGMEIPKESVVLGRPAKIIRKLTELDKEMIIRMRGNDISLNPSKENIIVNNLKEGDVMGKMYTYKHKHPKHSNSSIIFDTAEITGDVEIGENTIIGHGVRIVGNSHGPVKIGNNVQILENCVLHLLPDNELIIEDNVIIGPGSIIHGTTLGRGTIVESGSNICDYSILGENCLVKAGSLVKQKSKFSSNSIIEGFPAVETGKMDSELGKPEWAYTITDFA